MTLSELFDACYLGVIVHGDNFIIEEIVPIDRHVLDADYADMIHGLHITPDSSVVRDAKMQGWGRWLESWVVTDIYDCPVFLAASPR